MSDSDELHILDDVPLFFGRFLVTAGLISERDLEMVLTVQKDLGDCLLCVALENGLIALKDFMNCRAYQREKFATAEEALRHIAKLKDTDMERLTAFMVDVHIPIGEILVFRGLLTPEKLRNAIKNHEYHNSIVCFE